MPDLRLLSIVAASTMMPLVVKSAVYTGENVLEFKAFCRIAAFSEKIPQLRQLGDENNASTILADFQKFDLMTRPKATEASAGASTESSSTGVEVNQTFPDEARNKRLQVLRKLAQGMATNCNKLRKESGVSDSVRLALKKGVYGDSEKVGLATSHTALGSLQPADVFVQVSSANGDDAAASCGSGVSGVGKSLINDMFCLCVTKTHSAGPKEVCAKGLQAQASANWPGLGSSDGGWPNSWKKVYTACPPSKEELTAKAIRQAVEGFRNLIGRNVAINGESGKVDERNYAFGMVKADNKDCDGDGSGGAVCINYMAVIKTAGKGVEGIPWVAQYLEAARLMEEFTELTEKCENDLKHLAILRETAAALFGEAVSAASQEPRNRESGRTDQSKEATRVPSEKSSENTLIKTDRSSLIHIPEDIILLAALSV